MFDLSGRTALVTGASGGIGGGIARALHARGAHVLLTGRREEALAALAGELGGRSATISADTTAPGAAEELVAACEAQGGLHILVNNAGITRDQLALRMKDEDWSAVIDTNLTACFRLARAAIKVMMRRRQGRIINIASVIGVTGNAGQSNYAAAKAGLIGMSKALAAEAGSRSITVNCIAPGFIDTAMTSALGEEQRARLLESIPLRRFGTVEDVAAAAVYLASDQAAWVTGQTIHVNGGMAMP